MRGFWGRNEMLGLREIVWFVVIDAIVGEEIRMKRRRECGVVRVGNGESQK